MSETETLMSEAVPRLILPFPAGPPGPGETRLLSLATEPLGARVELELDARDEELLEPWIEAARAAGFTLLGLELDVREEVGCWRIGLLRGDGGGGQDDAVLHLRRLRDGATWPLSRSRETLLGRSRECQVGLESIYASGVHCGMRHARRAVALQDLRSASGTFLDNQPLSHALVLDFGLICLGRKESGHYLEMELRIPTGGAACLHVISGSNAGAAIPLLREATVLGRGAGCHQQIIAPYISRAHLRLTLLEDVVALLDRGSANGTRLNGRAVLSERLVPGDQIDAAGELFDVLAPAALRNPEPRSGWSLRMGEVALTLDRPLTRIGRHEDCEITSPEANLSREHARLCWEAGVLRLYDLRSAAGTFVNGRRVSTAVLQSGDLLEFGGLHAEVLGPMEQPWGA